MQQKFLLSQFQYTKFREKNDVKKITVKIRSIFGNITNF